MTKVQEKKIDSAVDNMIVAVDSKGVDRTADVDVLEEQGVAYNPARMPIDLSHAEKRRVTALMMAIQAYNNIIIKDADYLAETARLAGLNEGPAIRPATMDAMVEAAINFDAFISGRFDAPVQLQTADEDGFTTSKQTTKKEATP